MNDVRFYTLVATALVVTVVLAILAEYFQSLGLLFNVMLAVIGVLAGIMTNHYFAKKQERENLGKFASSAYRLSTGIYEGLTESISFAEQAKNTIKQDTLNMQVYTLTLDGMIEKLKVIQRSAIAANENWEDVLPPDQLLQLRKLEASAAFSIPISDRYDVRFTEEKIPLSHPLTTKRG